MTVKEARQAASLKGWRLACDPSSTQHVAETLQEEAQSTFRSRRLQRIASNQMLQVRWRHRLCLGTHLRTARVWATEVVVKMSTQMYKSHSFLVQVQIWLTCPNWFSIQARASRALASKCKYRSLPLVPMLSRRLTRVQAMMLLLDGRELANFHKSFKRARLNRSTSQRAATMKSSEESRQLISWWSCLWVAAWAELAICSC